MIVLEMSTKNETLFLERNLLKDNMNSKVRNALALLDEVTASLFGTRWSHMHMG